MFSAWSTFLPRIRSATSRPLSADRRTPRRIALVSIVGSLLLGLLVGRVTLERAGQREFAELVADHLVGHIHRHVLLAVVHGDRQADEVGQDRRTARPGLDRLLVLGRGGLLDLVQQVVVARTDPFSVNVSLRLLLTSCDARRSSSACACCCACGSPWSACSTATPAPGPRRCDLHHHRAGGRPGSWRRRAPSGGYRASGSHRPCRYWRRLCSSLPTSPIVARHSMWIAAHFTRAQAHLSVGAFARHQRHRACRPNARSARPCRAAFRRSESSSRPGCCGSAACCRP